MRIPSGVTDQYLYFVAVDATDYVTRETGLSSFTVYRSRNGGAATAYTTPTINETSLANMPGVYELLLDEDMTIDSGDDSQEVCLHITHAGMAPVTRVFELYRRDVTSGETLNVSSGALNAISDGLLTAAKFGADCITAAKVAADVGTEIAAAVWGAATRLLTGGDNIVLAKGTGITGFNDLSAADVNAEVDTALADYDGPTNAEMNARTLAAADYATATSLGTVDTVVDAIKVVTDKLDDTLEDDLGVYRFTTNALEQAPAGGGGGSGATAQEVWEYATRTLTAIDEDSTTLDLDATIRTAVGMASADLDTQLDGINANVDANEAKIDIIDTNVDTLLAEDGSSFTSIPWNASWDTEVESEVTDALTVYDVSTVSDLPATAPTAEDIANEVASRTLNANITKVNNVSVDGSGTTSDPWGPV